MTSNQLLGFAATSLVSFGLCGCTLLGSSMGTAIDRRQFETFTPGELAPSAIGEVVRVTTTDGRASYAELVDLLRGPDGTEPILVVNRERRMELWGSGLDTIPSFEVDHVDVMELDRYSAIMGGIGFLIDTAVVV